jgi:lycopene cyclase domain-containing protein
VTYSLTALVAVLAAIAVDFVVLRTRLVARRAFWTAYAILIGFQLFVNGVLTGLGVVRYDPRRIVGLRIAHAPVEDLLFGFALILVTLSVWVYLGRVSASRAPLARRVQPPQRDAEAALRRDG